MFNNPFDSFHNTVAEAKEEREQLDRLLTISTPRERLLIAVIALLLLILAVWLVYGRIGSSLAVSGVVVGGEERSVQALVGVERDAVPRIRTGMPVVVELDTADGEAEALDGEIVTISVVPLSETLTALASKAPVSVHRIDIALDESPDSASLVGRECRIVIELGRQSPAALLHPRRS